MSDLSRRAGALAASAGGAALSGATRIVSAVRPVAKPLHPRGDVVTGRLRRSGGGPATGSQWLDGPGSDEVLVRRSRALGLPTGLPDIHGQAVVAIDYAVSPADDGRSVIRPTVTAFLRLDSRFANSMARMAGAVAQSQADRKARRLARTFAKTTRAIEADPAGIYALVKQATTAPAGEVEAFRRLLNLPAAEAAPPLR